MRDASLVYHSFLVSQGRSFGLVFERTNPGKMAPVLGIKHTRFPVYQIIQGHLNLRFVWVCLIEVVLQALESESDRNGWSNAAPQVLRRAQDSMINVVSREHHCYF